MDYIYINRARSNNLKNISLKIPKKKITIFTGVSGSGKSSVVFETIAQESGRLLNETFSAFVRGFLPKYSQPDVDELINISPSIVIDQKRIGGNSRSTLGTITDIDPILRVLFSRIGVPAIGGMGKFSFNDPSGMCETCQGIGKTIGLDLDAALDASLSLNDGAIKLPGYGVGTWLWKFYAQSGFFDPDKKVEDYSPQEYEKFINGPSEKIHLEGLHDLNSTYEGLVQRFLRTNIKTAAEKSEKTKEKLKAFTKTDTCPACNGTRYNPEVLSCKINGYSIADFTAMEISKLVDAIANITNPLVLKLVENLVARLSDLIQIGLDYICLNRETSTLSGGESQRVKMVKNLSSSLTDMLYIFDEPSIGLHPRDVGRLNDVLMRLRDKGNTIIVVEHDPDVIKIADYIVDMGPHAGSKGGEVMYAGDYAGLATSNTLTARYLNAPKAINNSPRAFTNVITTKPSNMHNLKNVSVAIPQGVFTVITGVAGSGKSTLIHKVFAKEHTAVVIDQSAVQGNSRSNPATYTGIMDIIRQEFATATKHSTSLFSFNSDGACENCKGLGYVELNLSFMDNARNICEECNGKRFKTSVLDLHLNGKSIADVMELTISDAVDFFDSKEIASKLMGLATVGLGYLTLGQPLKTLSGGECQRIKLAKELNKKGNIYVMDEPTTGLHFSDIDTVLAIINALVKKGNTVVVIEHNLDIIRQADWVIDMGPGAGTNGGMVQFEGTPAELACSKNSVTGRYI